MTKALYIQCKQCNKKKVITYPTLGLCKSCGSIHYTKEVKSNESE